MPENKHYIELPESAFPDAIVALTPDEMDMQRLEYLPKSKLDDLLGANQAWQAENAKLRELVRDYDKCLDTALYLAGNAGYPCMPDSGLFSSLRPRMHELGVEVEHD